MAEEVYVNAKTSVWWDIENCHVPKGLDAHVIAQNIRSALSKLEYRGPVSITAYGDTKLLSPRVQEALSSTGIALHHVPSGVKDASDKKILVDMLFWAVDNPAPANYMLISGDRDFSNALHQLRLRRYNVLLARPAQHVSAPLIGAAKSIWLWANLARGEPALQNSLQDSEQTEKKGNSNVSNDVPKTDVPKTEPLEKILSFSELNFKSAVSQSMQSMPGVFTSKTTSHSMESNFQEAAQFQQKLSRHIPVTGHPNGQELHDISMGFAGTKPPVVTSEFSFPYHLHASALGNSNAVGSLSSLHNHIPITGHLNGQGQARNLIRSPGKKSPVITLEANFRSNSHVSVLGNSNAMGALPSLHNHIAVSGHPNGQAHSGNSNHFPGMKFPVITSEGNFPAHSHFSALENTNPMGTLSSLQHSMNVHYNNAKQFPTDPNSSINPSMKFSSFPPPHGKGYGAERNPFHPEVQPDIFPNPMPNLRPPITSSLSMENLPVSRTATSFDSGTIQQSHNVQGGCYVSNQMHQKISPEQTPTNPGNLNLNTSAQVHPIGRWLLPPEHNDTGAQIRIILQAIETLKQNMMVPSIGNIEDCIKYQEMHISNFDIHELLGKAVEQKEIVIMRAGGASPLYLPRATSLWKCVDPCNMHDNYPKEAWEEFHKYLSSFEGRDTIMKSERRYHAALMLKSCCLKNLKIGEIIHMLQLAIDKRRWLSHHQSGWQPLSITTYSRPL